MIYLSTLSVELFIGTIGIYIVPLLIGRGKIRYKSFNELRLKSCIVEILIFSLLGFVCYQLNETVLDYKKLMNIILSYSFSVGYISLFIDVKNENKK
ncbi:hypothetical protein HBN50_00865 [Halobacteriovorax sp. GB3]|uniref:hypothetical protein n=1 Tax=Halobacteriovorax sp. GB3 TaxID=2719615 RepID=UPI002361C409|nr:hypothetical protein [Halobacteriovorax sp. GB3]MDD0851617.1 hypothetical protein [Halobacteriovorax sp. GB3]